MASVGVIANPASGKDIRRLVAHGSVFDNNEKANIVRRVLMGLEAAGVEEVVFMPDYFGVGQRAMAGVSSSLRAGFLDMEVTGTQEDSTTAARLMREQGVKCIITLGGDGTNRVVAKGCGEIPLVPISTGTNNVFPTMMEGTVAGLAAGVVAAQGDAFGDLTWVSKRLEVYAGGQLVDIALIDVVVSADRFIGARALWDTANIREVFLTRAESHQIGMCSVGGNLCCVQPSDPWGLHLTLGAGNSTVLAAIAPGLFQRVEVSSFQRLEPDQRMPLSASGGVLALDGERDLELRRGRQVEVMLTQSGPRGSLPRGPSVSR